MLLARFSYRGGNDGERLSRLSKVFIGTYGDVYSYAAACHYEMFIRHKGDFLQSSLNNSNIPSRAE